MTKTITNKAIAFIVAFAMVFTAFSFAESVYAAPADIEVINDSTQLPITDIQVTDVNYDTDFSKVIPFTYSTLQLKLSDYTPTEEEKEAFEDFSGIGDRVITDRYYFKLELLADGNPVTETLNNSGLHIRIALEGDTNDYVRSCLLGPGGAEYYTSPGQEPFWFTYEDEFSDFRMAFFKVDVSGSINNAKISNIVTKQYTGKSIYQSPVVKLAGTTLKKGTDYSIQYWDNKNVGKATMNFWGEGKYGGYLERTFKIIPAKAKIKSTAAKKRALKVTIAKKAAAYGTKKFQIRYKIKGAKKWKTKFVTSRTPTIKKLKKGKRYVVQVRAYKNKSYVGKWSLKKTSKKIK